MKINPQFFKKEKGIKTNVKLLENIQEYMEVVEYLSNNFNNDLWYRGVSHAKYELIPKVYRLHLQEINENFEWWISTDFTNKQ